MAEASPQISAQNVVITIEYSQQQVSFNKETSNSYVAMMEPKIEVLRNKLSYSFPIEYRKQNEAERDSNDSTKTLDLGKNPPPPKKTSAGATISKLEC